MPRSAILSFCRSVVAAAPRRVLGLTFAMVAVAAWFAIDTPGALSPAGYEVSGSESTTAAEIIDQRFAGGAPNIVILASSSNAIDAASVRAQGVAATEALAELPGLTQVASYWTTGSEALRGADGRQALMQARALGSEDDSYELVRQVRTLLDQFATDQLTFDVGGSAASNLEMVEVAERDLLRAELLVMPLTTIVLLVVFRSVVAALLPLIVSAVAVVGTALALRGLSEVTLVSIFGLNLTTALGLGMAIDYSLLIINRWREERPHCDDAQQAVLRSLDTAGRSVLFSGMTTAATLAALLLFDYPLLRSLALAGFVVVALATFGALVALPAAMYVLGDGIDAGRVRAARPIAAVEDGRWYRIAMAVMRRPRRTIVAVMALLVLLGLPFLRAEFGLPDERVLPDDASARITAEGVRANFPLVNVGSIAVYQESPGAADADSTGSLAGRLSVTPGVATVRSASGIWVDGFRVADDPLPQRFTVIDDGPDATWFEIETVHHPMSPAAADVVRALRSTPIDGRVEVGGEPARLVDNTDEIARKLPLVIGWIAMVIAVLLFVSFRSVLVPLKAFVLNLVSLSASFGAIVWIFQDGRFAGLLDYTPTGSIDAQTPVLMFCIAFGLSMDYEVFLLSRIREEHLRCGDTRRAVAVGLQRTGGVISAAAVLMAIVFLSFATGDVTFIQMVGIGLALAILVDAFIVRTLLVPAFMTLAGEWNWWAPRAVRPHIRPHPTEPVAVLAVKTEGA